jgi:hypothetical protein
MISTLVAALILISPTPLAPVLKKCANACYRDDLVYVCGYWEKYRCGRQEFECIDSPTMICEPNEVRLGSWDPVLLNYKVWHQE